MILKEKLTLKELDETIYELYEERDSRIEYMDFMKKDPFGRKSFLDVHFYSLRDVFSKFGELSSLLEEGKSYCGLGDVYTDLSTIPKILLAPLKKDEEYFQERYYFFLKPLSPYLKEIDSSFLLSIKEDSLGFIRKSFSDSISSVKSDCKGLIKDLGKKLSGDYIESHYSSSPRHVGTSYGDGFRSFYRESDAYEKRGKMYKDLEQKKLKLRLLDYCTR